MLDSSFAPAAKDIISNTYAKSGNQKGAKAWTNDYYDDEGWWAMAWIASYDLTKDIKYLNTAIDIFNDMNGGWNTPCNGGIWWDKQRTYIAAIANELFLTVAASIANRVGSNDKDEFLNWAQMEWDWFKNSGIINSEGLINDGIDDTTCTNNGRQTYTYNQGVILAGLSELKIATGDVDTTNNAIIIAMSAMAHLTDNGILTEQRNGPLDVQGALFKGPFALGLASLYEVTQEQDFKDFLQQNADSAWSQPKIGGDLIPDRWQGGSSNANSGSQTAGMDLMIAAAELS